ncbi:MAG TPA: hypothetical protein VGK67_01375 [Myxococcales bacterium]|jgi:hypothetical protein
MRHRILSLVLLSCSLGLALAVGCGENGAAGKDAGTGRADGGPAGLDADEIINPVPDTGPKPDTGSVGPTNTIIFAHTGLSLFQGSPATSPLELTKVGDFDCGSQTDVAVDKDGKLFAVSSSAIHPLEIIGSTVHCTATWTLKNANGTFYGLTFAPAGVLGAEEMLVAANSAGELWAVDNQGNATQVGTFGNVPADDGRGHSYNSKNVGKAWELSGDIVFLTNSGNPVGFATLVDCPTPPSKTGCNTVDTLAEIDISKLKLGNTSSVTKSIRGQVVKSAACTDTSPGYGSMYGIAAWNDKVFGFSYSGNLVEISNQDGSACLVKTYGDKFAGAGVTTLAPIIEPN